MLPCCPLLPSSQVEVDLSLSAHANARAYYDSRKKHQVGLEGSLWRAVQCSWHATAGAGMACPRPAQPTGSQQCSHASASYSAFPPLTCPQVKQQRTLDANQKALKAAEKKAQAQLKQVEAVKRFGWSSATHYPAVQACKWLHPSKAIPSPPSCHPPATRLQVRSAAPVITRKPFWFERFHWFISSGAPLMSGRCAVSCL